MPKKTREDDVMAELEESYRKSKSAPAMPESMRQELNNLSSSNSDEDEDDAMSYFSKLADS